MTAGKNPCAKLGMVIFFAVANRHDCLIFIQKRLTSVAL